MEIAYAILKKAKIVGANAEQNAYVVGAPSPLGFHAYAEAYAHNAAKRGLKLNVSWVLPIYHQLSEDNLQESILKRELGGIDDKMNKVIAPPVRDELRIDFDATLVVAFEVEDMPELEEFQLTMRKSLPPKLCGGSVFLNPLDEDELVLTTREDWREEIKDRAVLYGSHVLLHRPDVTGRAKDISQLLTLILNADDYNLSPIAIGYQPISSAALREGARDTTTPHVFVDPLISTGQWRSAYEIFSDGIPLFWSIDSSNTNIFTITSKQEFI